MAIAADGIQNPEPIINAVLAALKAQESAFLTNWLLVALLLIAIVAVVCAALILSKVNTIQEHTNGMHTALVETTRKLALIEGEVKGRASQRTEDFPEPKEVT
jgi:hypothetical protein